LRSILFGSCPGRAVNLTGKGKLISRVFLTQRRSWLPMNSAPSAADRAALHPAGARATPASTPRRLNRQRASKSYRRKKSAAILLFDKPTTSRKKWDKINSLRKQQRCWVARKNVSIGTVELEQRRKAVCT
jgi:hypothetical protein